VPKVWVPMVETVQDVFGLLLKSGLLPADDARALLDRWQADGKDRAPDPRRFIAWLVSNNYLTDYQGSLLVRGFSEGFFLNEYKVLERLGQGRMAGVFKARHRLGQVVAIKVLPPSKAREPNMKSRFLREARLALQLRHPNVVRAFQVGEANGLHYLVMEHLEGETFAELFAKRGRYSPAEAVRLTYQALQGLQHIHALGLVHRDIKPSNLMLVYPGGIPDEETMPGTVKILDIGLGRQLLDEGPSGDDTALTSEGVVLGTPEYMAPEQARDPRAADIRSDIYSLGCVLYQALAGRAPFADTNLLNLMIRHATEEPLPLNELNPAVTDELRRIIARMMAKEPSERYSTPQRAAEALQVFVATGGSAETAPENDPGMLAYLSWLEKQVIHADLPSWLAEMDTVTASQMLRAKAGSVDSSRTSAPVRPSRPPRTPEEQSAASEKTKVVRKLAGGSRTLDRPPPVVIPDPGTPAPLTVSPLALVAPHPPEKALAPVVPSRDAKPPPPEPGRRRFSRRDVLVFALGAALAAVATFIGCLIVLDTRTGQEAAPTGTGQRKKRTP
jgi:eukaryotic-like serine/threonine-protein kinase